MGAGPGLVSVIVPARNGVPTLPGLLGSLERQTYEGPWEVIVADNGSSDETRGLVMGWAGRLPGLRVVDASARRGVSFAKNAAARVARGWLLAFIDQDDVADPGWLQALVGAAGPSAFVTGRCEMERLNPATVRSWYDADPSDRPPEAHHFLPYAVGANTAIAAGLLRSVGGWDESLVGGGEDVDLSWKVQLSGSTLTYVADAIVHKRRRETLGELARQQFSNGMASVRVYKRFRAHLRPQPPLSSLRAWGYIALTALDLLRSPARRGRWVNIAARRLGRLVGSIRERVFFV